ncbi:hypothetical protein ACWERI_35265, partial [Streptomyces collinus]
RCAHRRHHPISGHSETAQYLGHSDPGFTLRTYTHLMPSSEGRTREAVERLYRRSLSPRDSKTPD